MQRKFCSCKEESRDDKSARNLNNSKNYDQSSDNINNNCKKMDVTRPETQINIGNVYMMPECDSRIRMEIAPYLNYKHNDNYDDYNDYNYANNDDYFGNINPAFSNDLDTMVTGSTDNRLPYLETSTIQSNDKILLTENRRTLHTMCATFSVDVSKKSKFYYSRYFWDGDGHE